jgi:hypothetical protein
MQQLDVDKITTNIPKPLYFLKDLLPKIITNEFIIGQPEDNAVVPLIIQTVEDVDTGGELLVE